MEDETEFEDAERRLGHLLERAQIHLAQALELFQGKIERMRDDPDLLSADADKTTRVLLAAVETVFRIELKLHDHRGRCGEARSGPDLEAARERVGTLLDRLRAADGPE